MNSFNEYNVDKVYFLTHSGKPLLPEDIIVRLLSKVKFGSAEECWIWQGCVGSHGYGQLSINKIPNLTHRLMCMLYLGQIAEGKQIDHLCGNKRCVNPRHLEAVSPKENIQRAFARGDHDSNIKNRIGKRLSPATEFKKGQSKYKGENHGYAKLTKEDIINIRQLALKGIRQRAIAKMFGVCQQNISRIVSRKNWKEVK